MLPLHLFRSRTFTLTNVLTLLLYGALGVVLFLLPLELIQVQHYTALEAGAALVPLAIIMFGLSRWAGGLIVRVGARLPLTVGPVIAAVGIGLLARAGMADSYWSTIFPAVCLLGFGMTITVAPLTTAVMGAVETAHSGVASGINNTVARVAGLLTIAIFGVVLARAFDAQVQPRLEHLALPPVRQNADRSAIAENGGRGAEVSAAGPPTTWCRPAVDRRGLRCGFSGGRSQLGDSRTGSGSFWGGHSGSERRDRFVTHCRRKDHAFVAHG